MKLAAPCLALLSVLLSAPALTEETRCPTAADLDRGIVFKGGLGGATLTVTPPPLNWIEDLGLTEDPNVQDYRFMELDYPIGSKYVHQSAARLSYKGLIEKAFSAHLIAASISYDGDEEMFFPLKANTTKVITFRFDSAVLDDMRSEWTGSLELETEYGKNRITIGSCEYEAIEILSNRNIEVKHEGGESETMSDKSTIYYLPELQSPFAIVHVPDDGEAWVQGMFDTVEALSRSTRRADE